MAYITHFNIPLTTSGQLITKLDSYLQDIGFIREDHDYTLDVNNDPAVGWIIYSTQGESSQEPKNYFRVYFGGYDGSDSTKIYFDAFYYWDTASHVGIGKNKNAKTINISSSIQYFMTIIGNKDLVYIETNINNSFTGLFFGLVSNKLYYPQTTTSANVNAGSNVQITVNDTSIFTLNEKYSIYGQNGEGRETFLCTNIDTSTNTITVDSLSINYQSGAIIGRNVYTGFVMTSPSSIGFHTMEHDVTGTNNVGYEGNLYKDILYGDWNNIFNKRMLGYFACNKRYQVCGYFNDNFRCSYDNELEHGDFVYNNKAIDSYITSATANTIKDISGAVTSVEPLIDTLTEFDPVTMTGSGIQYWHQNYYDTVTLSSDTPSGSGQSVYTKYIYQIFDLYSYKTNIDAGLGKLQIEFMRKNNSTITLEILFYGHGAPPLYTYTEDFAAASTWTSTTSQQIIIPETTRFIIMKLKSNYNVYIDDVIATYTDGTNTDNTLIKNGSFEDTCNRLSTSGYKYDGIMHNWFDKSKYSLIGSGTEFSKTVDVSAHSTTIDAGNAYLKCDYHITGVWYSQPSGGHLHHIMNINFLDSSGNIISSTSLDSFYDCVGAHDFIDLKKIINIPVNTRSITFVRGAWIYINHMKIDYAEKQGSSTYSGLNLVDKYILITFGKGTGQMAKIISHTSDTLTLDRDFDTIPDNTSAYIIVDNLYYATTMEYSYTPALIKMG